MSTWSETNPLTFRVLSTPVWARELCTISSLIIGDLAALAVSLVVASSILATLGLGYSLRIDVWWLSTVLAFPFIYAAAGLYRGINPGPVRELRVCAVATTFAFLATYAISSIGGRKFAGPQLAIVIAWPIATLGVPFARGLLRTFLSRRTWWGVRAVVIGNGLSAQNAIRTLRDKPGCGIKPEIVFDESQSCESCDLPVIRDINALKIIVSERQICHCVIPYGGTGAAGTGESIERFAEVFPKVVIIPDEIGLLSPAANIIELGTAFGVQLTHSLLIPWRRAAKRLIDLALVVVSVTFLLPIVSVIVLLIKITSGSPVLFGQTRIGRNGDSFTAWKFRTMVKGADVVLARHLREDATALEEWEKNHKLRNDPRVTWIGRVLRRSSLDELPQLWNVLCGEMSLVGPRPIVEEEVAKYGTAFELYCKVSPGLTGLWQTSGRNDTTYRERVELDEYYVRNWSIWLDAYIFARTWKAVVTAHGAY